jgi:CheY-like chemotaxis protein
MPGYLLAVDDDSAILTALESVCQVKGVRYTGMSTGPEAIRAAMADQPALILLDLNMPGMDGPEVFRALRAAGVGSPTMLMSATVERLDQQAAALGFDGWLQKPFALAEVFTLLDRFLAPHAV